MNVPTTEKAASVLCPCPCSSEVSADEHPIEKVISMLQDLSAKAEAEGKEEALAYEKYEYFVKNSVKDLGGAQLFPSFGWRFGHGSFGNRVRQVLGRQIAVDT